MQHVVVLLKFEALTSNKLQIMKRVYGQLYKY